MAGMFALPEYGGNKNLVGDDLIALKVVWDGFAPFGHYDADYIEKVNNLAEFSTQIYNTRDEVDFVIVGSAQPGAF